MLVKDTRGLRGAECGIGNFWDNVNSGTWGGNGHGWQRSGGVGKLKIKEL